MKLSKRILALATALALATGAGAMSAAPVAAKLDKKSSETIISFKKSVLAELTTAGISINPSNGATFARGVLRFPVSAVGDGYIAHSGCVTFAKGSDTLEVCDPMISYPTSAPSKTWDLTVTYLGATGIPLMTLQHVKSQENCSINKNKKTKKFTKSVKTKVQADAHLTDNSTVVGILEAAFGPVFSADMGLGSSRTTLIDQTVSKRKKKC